MGTKFHKEFFSELVGNCVRYYVLSSPLSFFAAIHNSPGLPHTCSKRIKVWGVLRACGTVRGRVGHGVSLAAGLFLLVFSLARASGPGTGSANFLKIPVGAKETSLGGAVTSVADSANAVYYNPAGLSLLKYPEITFAHNKFVEGVSQQWLAAAYPRKSGVLGFGLNYLSVPAFPSYDNDDNRTGSVSAYNLAAYLSWGSNRTLNYKFFRSVSYGAGIKYISEKLASENGSGFGLDLGILAATAVENLRFGLSVENAISTKISFIGEGARPPFKLKTGVTYKIQSSNGPSLQLLLDYVFWGDRPGYIAAGIESLVLNGFAVRMGYSGFGDISNGLNFGLGFILSKYTGRSVCIDYSYGTTRDFGDIYKLSVSYKFGRRMSSGSPGTLKIMPAAKKVIPEPASKKVIPEPAAKKVIPEPAARKVMPGPAATKVISEPESTQTVPEPAATQTVPEPNATQAIPEPEAEPEATQAIPEPAAGKGYKTKIKVWEYSRPEEDQ